MISIKNTLVGLSISFITIVGFAQQVANTVYVNAEIYTVNPNSPWAESMAVKDGKILAMGSMNDIDHLIDTNTTVVDLDGQMVMPGIHDAHTHLEWAGIVWNHECSLPEAGNQDQIVATLKACQRKRPGGWLTAGIYLPFIFKDAKANNDFLNEAFPDTPVYLADYSFHHGLANNRALELAGITADTANPHGGVIVKDTMSGNLTGELVETANSLMQRKVPAYDRQTYVDAVRWSIAMFNRYGITSVQEASASKRLLEILNELDSADELSLRVSAHLVWKYEKFADSNLTEMRQLIEDRNNYNSERIDTRFIKMWLDGAPLPPNLTQGGLDANGNIQTHALLYTQPELNSLVTELDNAGYTIKMHVAGDGAARTALNAIEQTRKLNRKNNNLHELSHAAFVHPDDMARMQGLGAVAEMSPAMWHIDTPGIDKMPGAFKFKSMQDQNVHMVVGTDWILVPTPNLFPALEGMLDREEESIDLTTAIKTMTLNGAIVTRQDHLIGSLETGKMATFIVLNQNLFDIPISEISETTVELTVIEDEVVYSQ
jgi:predicted amidohydrolase YtcJ